MRTLSRARRAIAALIGGLLLVPVMLMLQQQSSTESSMLALSEARQAPVAGLAASTIGNELAGVADAMTDAGRRFSTTTAFDPATADPADTGRLTADLRGLRAAFRNVQVTYALDVGGRLLVSDPAQPELYGKDFSFGDWYRGALSQDSAYVSEGYRSLAAGQPLGVGVAMAVRATGAPDQVIGMLGGLYLIDRVQDLVDEHGSATGMRMTVVDRRGTVIARTGGIAAELATTGDRRLLDRLARPVAETTTGRTAGEGAVVSAARPIPETGGAVLTEVSVDIALAGLPQRSHELQAVLLLLVVVVALAVAVAVRLEQRRARAQAVLQTREAQLAEAARLAGLGSFSVETSTMTFTFDDALFTLWGVPPHDPLRHDPRVFADHVLFPEDQPRVRAAFEQGLVDGGRHEIGFRIRRVQDGAVRHIRSDVDVVLGADGSAQTIIGTQLDVTELIEAHAELQEAGALHDAMLSALPDVIVLTDARTDAPIYASPGVELLTGRTPRELIALGSVAAATLVHPDDLPALIADDRTLGPGAEGEVVVSRYRCRHTDGTWRHVARRATPFARDDAGQVISVLSVLRDVSDLVEAERRLEHAALHDALTGLPNRGRLLTEVSEALERSRRTGREPAVLYLDLDGFKRVNDTGGHAAGDALLQAIAGRLAQAVRPQDTVARLGGDEFVVLVQPRDRLPGGRAGDDGDGGEELQREADRNAALAVARRVCEVVALPVHVGPHGHVVSASVGVAFAGPGLRGTAGAESLLQDADAAMYLAKHSGKNRVETFTASLRSDLDESGRIERLLREVLPAHAGGRQLVPWPRQTSQLGVAFQPVLTRSGGLVGFEALARLSDEAGRPIPPARFIALAETAGLIRGVGSCVLDKALAQLARWRAQGPDRQHLRMAVNLSAQELQDTALVSSVLTAVAAHGLQPEQLVLELTETVLLDAGPASLTALRRLRETGVGISIDDFGTGWASLRYLAELPVTAVKIDARFTAGLPHDPTSVKIVRAISGLAADLGLSCVVEGVETLEQQGALPDGVLMQGYLLGRPVPAIELDLSTPSWRTALGLGSAELAAGAGDLAAPGVAHGRVHAGGA